jgi:hypothetical protein
MPFQGRGPRQRRTRQRPRYGLNLACGRPGALVQLMRLTLFLVVDSAAGMSAVVAITLPELGTQRNFARTVVNGGHARLNEVNDARAASGYLQPNGIR